MESRRYLGFTVPSGGFEVYIYAQNVFSGKIRWM